MLPEMHSHEVCLKLLKHLLNLPESLREEVNRVPAPVSEIDAKAHMMITNQSVRLHSELAYKDAASGGLCHQVQWLVSGKMQNQHRMVMVRSQAASSSLAAGSALGASSEGAGIVSSSNTRQPDRRTNNAMRQETKLWHKVQREDHGPS